MPAMTSVPRERLVVGVDRRGRSQAALDWAAAEAGRRGADLDVVYAFMPPPVISPIGVPGPAEDAAPYEVDAKRVLDDAIDSVPYSIRHTLPHVSPLAVMDRASSALLDTAEGADLLVVGTRKRGAVGGLIGSVSHQCVHHAHCPVVVVPPGWTVTPPKRIVVGVDGSEPSAAALRWALDEAHRWKAAITVVHAWNTPYPVEPWGVVVTPIDRDAFRAGSKALVDKMVKAAGAGSEHSVDAMLVEEAAGPGLVGAAADADLLVVGSRGRGGFAALLVGSVSLHCVQAARCPVAVIRPVS